MVSESSRKYSGSSSGADLISLAEKGKVGGGGGGSGGGGNGGGGTGTNAASSSASSSCSTTSGDEESHALRHRDGRGGGTSGGVSIGNGGYRKLPLLVDTMHEEREAADTGTMTSVNIGGHSHQHHQHHHHHHHHLHAAPPPESQDVSPDTLVDTVDPTWSFSQRTPPLSLAHKRTVFLESFISIWEFFFRTS